MNPLPTGTITFLFTDLQGSAATWEQHEFGMRLALAREEALLREAFLAVEGTIVKSTGDGFFAVFGEAPQALEAAIAAQRAVQAEDWRCFGDDFPALQVRIGLHTGTAEHRDGDFNGRAVNRAARVMSAGHGGQILLSQATQTLLRDTKRQGWDLRHLGLHHLKGLAYPEEIYQVVVEGLPDVATPIVTEDRWHRERDLPIQVPPELEALVRANRVQELATLQAAIEGQQVTSVLGIGGVGKSSLTRVALAERPGGLETALWLDCEGAPDATLDEILQRIATRLAWDDPGAAWKDQRPAGAAEVQRLAERLRAGPPFCLVFDGLDAWLDGKRRFRNPTVAELFKGLAKHPHQARVLVTTRVLPKLPRDKALGGTLDRPDLLLTGLGRDDGVALLRRRIRTANPDEAQLGELVDRVGGHPWALELLASQVDLVGLEALLDASPAGLADAETGLRRLAERIVTRLSTADRRLLRQLAVYRGPQPLDVFEHLVGNLEQAQATALRLAAEQLLSRETLDTLTAYRLQPAFREALLTDLGAKRLEAHRSAYAFYIGLPLPAEGAAWRLESYASLVEAHHHALSGKAPQLALAVLLDYALPERLQQCGAQDRLIALARSTLKDYRDAEDWPAALAAKGYTGLDAATNDPLSRALRLRRLGICARWMGALRPAAVVLEQGIGILTSEGNPDDPRVTEELARSYGELAIVLQRLGERSDEALRWSELALDQWPSRGPAGAFVDRAALHASRALLLGSLDRHEESIVQYQRARGFYQAEGLSLRAADMVDMQGVELQRMGRLDKAIEQHQEALDVYTSAGHRYGAAAARLNLGAAEHSLKQWDAARASYEAACADFEAVQDERGTMVCRLNQGELLLDADAAGEALPILMQALRQSQSLGEGEYRSNIEFQLGRTFQDLDNPDEAETWLKQALTDAEASGNAHVAGMAREALERSARDPEAAVDGGAA